MRIIYRSASKLRFQSNVSSWVLDVLHKASLLLLAKIGRRTLTQFCLNALAWTIFVVFLPLEILLFLFAWIYSFALLRLVRWLEKDAKRVEIMTSVGQNQDNDMMSLMLTLEGSAPDTPDVIERISRLVHRAILTQHEGKKLRYTLGTHLGCHVWKRDHAFKVDNHIIMESGIWRGSQIIYDNLRYWLNYTCNQKLPKNRPPWRVTVVPYVDRARTQCHALLVRLHRSLVPCFKLSDLLVCEPSNFELKKAVAEALQFNEAKPKIKTKFEETKERLKSLCDVMAKVSWMLWIAPRVLYTELIASYRYLSEEPDDPSGTADKSLFWSKDMSKDLLLKIKQVSTVSTTGILMSCLAGATRQYRIQTGEEAPDTIHNLMPYHEEDALSVQGLLPHGFRSLTLPADLVDSSARLQVVNRGLKDRRVQSAQSEISSFVLGKLYRFVPPILIRVMGHLISMKYHVVLDNAYVSDNYGTLWERPVNSVFFWRPPSTNIGTSLSFVHYDDKVSLCLSTKRRVYQRPDLLVSLLEREVYALALALNVRIERKPSPPSSPTRLFKSIYTSS